MGTVYSRVNRGLLRVYVAVAGAVVYPGQEKEAAKEAEEEPGYKTPGIQKDLLIGNFFDFPNNTSFQRGTRPGNGEALM